ncbi:MAG: hypothetical protein ACXW2X_06495, partial [Thermoanaerobaculia bacterium]
RNGQNGKRECREAQLRFHLDQNSQVVDREQISGALSGCRLARFRQWHANIQRRFFTVKQFSNT